MTIPARAALQLPASGGEGYAPGIDDVIIGRTSPASQPAAVNTLPLYYGDGSIGTLAIGKIGQTAQVYEGESPGNLKKGLGHFSSTSAWDGNCALAGHNRSGFFGYLKDAQIGDRLTYATPYGTRTYEVYSKTQIDEWDNSALGYSPVNILTLITCVEGVPDMRWLVQAREAR
jgi:sortase A